MRQRRTGADVDCIGNVRRLPFGRYIRRYRDDGVLYRAASGTFRIPALFSGLRRFVHFVLRGAGCWAELVRVTTGTDETYVETLGNYMGSNKVALNRCVARVCCKSSCLWLTALPQQLHTDNR